MKTFFAASLVAAASATDFFGNGAGARDLLQSSDTQAVQLPSDGDETTFYGSGVRSADATDGDEPTFYGSGSGVGSTDATDGDEPTFYGSGLRSADATDGDEPTFSGSGSAADVSSGNEEGDEDSPSVKSPDPMPVKVSMPVTAAPPVGGVLTSSLPGQIRLNQYGLNGRTGFNPALYAPAGRNNNLYLGADRVRTALPFGVNQNNQYALPRGGLPATGGFTRYNIPAAPVRTGFPAAAPVRNGFPAAAPVRNGFPAPVRNGFPAAAPVHTGFYSAPRTQPAPVRPAQAQYAPAQARYAPAQAQYAPAQVQYAPAQVQYAPVPAQEDEEDNMLSSLLLYLLLK